jgi:hypothetical protein
MSDEPKTNGNGSTGRLTGCVAACQGGDLDIIVIQ